MSLVVNQVYHGFVLNKVKKIAEITATAYTFLHEKSGARLLYLENDDDNKVFSITFRTPPNDSTGVAHIVEHSVLCGSRKFPMKEPFVELVKGSLNTYLNAMTFPDKTMYPVASRNDKDFQNLMDVYLDAVFYPKMYDLPEILMQEGWHYEIEDKTAPLAYKGVVYNEMKGAFSSPEAVLDKEILTALFPDTTYGYESGGDPEVIPELTQEMFLNFHNKYYHPANSYIYLYGKMDILEKLAFLDAAYLKDFNKQMIDSQIEQQEIFDEPQLIVSDYPISESEQLQDKTFLSLNCIVGQADETEVMLAMQILEHFLLRTQSAPLKKALIDAEIGKDVLSSFSESILQPTFSIIVSGSNEGKIEKFKNVIQSTLEKLVHDGIDKELIEASINLLEFRLREADYGQSPKGLVYNIKLMNTWLYDADPLLQLEYEKPLQKVKAALTTDYFERLIQTRLLDNSHVALVVLKPNQKLAQVKSAELQKHLDDYKQSLSSDEIDQLIAMTKQLKLRQETADTSEVLATIPLLELKDIKPEAEKLVLAEKSLAGNKVLFHPITTNGIAYIGLYFDAAAVPANLVPYSYLLSELLGKVTAGKYEYADLANAINLHTGGISYDIFAYTESDQPDSSKPKFKLKAKALIEKLPQLTDLLSEILLESRFDDKKRLKELIEQIKSSLEMYLLRNAQQVIAGRILSYFSLAGKYNEQGILSFYEFTKDLMSDIDNRLPEIQENLAKVQKILFNRHNLLTSITVDEDKYDTFCEKFTLFYDRLTMQRFNTEEFPFAIDRRNEGLMTSSKIQYVGKGANFIRLGYQYTGSLKVLETILRYDYFWNRIRVQGGAYGAFTQFRRNGCMIFGSYRDPNLAETVEVYDRTADYLRQFAVSEREMVKYIIGTMSSLDTPLTPQMKGEVAAECYIRSITQENLQKERDEVLATRQEDIQKLADLIDACMAENYLCVLGGEQKIKENKEIFYEIKNVFA